MPLVFKTDNLDSSCFRCSLNNAARFLERFLERFNEKPSRSGNLFPLLFSMRRFKMKFRSKEEKLPQNAISHCNFARDPSCYKKISISFPADADTLTTRNRQSTCTKKRFLDAKN